MTMPITTNTSSTFTNLTNNHTSLIERIADWINGIDYTAKNALVNWIYGSSKARSATLPGDESQGVAKYAVQTLAYELAMRLPQQFCEQLLQSVGRDPRLFSRSLDVQVSKLIFEPLGHTGVSGR